MLLHDNTRPHSARIMKEILDLGWSVLPHPPYSSDLAPNDFHLHHSLQNALNDKKILSRRSGKNIWEKLLKLKTN